MNIRFYDINHCIAVAVGLMVICFALSWGTAARAQASDLIELDILVIYTPAVVALYYDEAGVIAHATASVESMNMALDNSEIAIVFNLVAIKQVDYVESSTNMSDDLEYITGRDDDFIDEDLLAAVRDLRDTYGADLVVLFRNGPAGGLAGIAWTSLLNDGSHRFGYSVVSAQSALSNLVLAHELGHNLSSGHGHGEAGSAPFFGYARGHRFTANDNNYRTIMSINSNHQRIPHFSNPLVIFEGEPTGVTVGGVYEADNASAFALSGPHTAEFRVTQTETPVFLKHPLSTTVVSAQSARLFAFVQGFPPLDIQWYNGTVGDTSTPIGSTDELQDQGGTLSFIETSTPSEATFYWLDLTNANGTTRSEPIQVVVIPPLDGPQLALVKQGKVNTGISSAGVTLYQDVFLSNNYVESIDIRIAKQGNPPPATLQFSTIDGEVLAETTIEHDAIPVWSSSTLIFLNVNRFTEPGRTYRISLIHPDADNSNRFLWRGGTDSQDAEAGIGGNNIQAVGNIAFTFTVHGQVAWTYHTWLGAEGISSTAGHPTDAVANDGVANLVRYALGFGVDDPRTLIAPLLGTVTQINGDDVIPFVFSVRRDAVDVGIVIETSTDLISWTDLALSYLHYIETVEDSRDVYEARIPLAGEARQFVRIRVDNPPN